METKLENQTEATTEVQEETQEQESAGLNINDLSTLRAIIDLASTRGAFKAAELAAVGTAYNRLNNFLEQVAKQSETSGTPE